MKRTLALATLFAALSCLGCSAPKSAQHPSIKARAEKTLAAHSAQVWQVAFSPDGRYLASASVDKTVKLWRMPEAELARTLTHPEGVTSIAFSPDGQQLATGSYDRALRIWNLLDGSLARTLEGHEGTVWTVAFSADGERVATCGDDSTVRLWRVSDGTQRRALSGGSEHVYAVTFSPDGRFVASGSRERGGIGMLWKQLTGARLKGKNLRLWQASDGELQQALQDHPDDIHSLAFSPDGTLLAASGQ